MLSDGKNSAAAVAQLYRAQERTFSNAREEINAAADQIEKA
jgi:hypothetical protein